MNNFNQLTKEELNRALAGMCFPKSEYPHIVIYDDGGRICYFEDWLDIPKDERPDRESVRGVFNPTHKDSNQLLTHVIPKLAEKGLSVFVDYWNYEVVVESMIKSKSRGEICIELNWDDPDKINETIAICVLEANEVMK